MGVDKPTILPARLWNAFVVFVQVPHVIKQEPHLRHRRRVCARLLLQRGAALHGQGAAQGGGAGAGGASEHRGVALRKSK